MNDPSDLIQIAERIKKYYYQNKQTNLTFLDKYKKKQKTGAAKMAILNSKFNPKTLLSYKANK
jgi:hypothetical protein